MVAYAFNAQQYEPKYGGGGGLPVGKYKVRICDSRAEPTKDGQGGYLAFDLTPIEGPLVGQIQTDRLNLHNKSSVAVEIANKQLSAYCHVLGKFTFQDTRELHDIPFIAEIRPQKNDPNFTEVGAIWDINGNEPGKAGAGPVAPQGGFTGAPPPQAGPPAGYTGPQGGNAGGAWPNAGGAGGGAGGPPDNTGAGWPSQGGASGPPAAGPWQQGQGGQGGGNPPWGAR